VRKRFCITELKKQVFPRFTMPLHGNFSLASSCFEDSSRNSFSSALVEARFLSVAARTILHVYYVLRVSVNFFSSSTNTFSFLNFFVLAPSCLSKGVRSCFERVPKTQVELD
jgi:hypothetical protein